MAIFLIDSYVAEVDTIFGLYNGDRIYAGQSFITGAGRCYLDSCKFSLYKTLLPKGYAYAKLYAHTGIYGVDGTPTGSALAVSDAIDVETLPGTYPGAYITFTFSGDNRIDLTPNTHYFIECYYTGGDSSNYIRVGSQYTTPTASGNESDSNDGINWTSRTHYDVCFYVYGDVWKYVSKHSSLWTHAGKDDAKHLSDWTNPSKNNSAWTNPNKNISAWTHPSKNDDTWTHPNRN